jgi:4-hydroxy-tetrahydrodipicolinate synthase
LRLEGIYVPNVTPFDAEGNIIYDSLGELIDFWIDSGVSGIVANASTGEGPYLSRGEQMSIVEFVVGRVDGRAQVMAGTGAMGTRETIEMTREAADAGAEVALVTTPYFFKPTDEELFQHYARVLGATKLPVILYNVPKFTGYSISPRVVARIASECSGLAGIKDSSGNPGTMAEVIRLCGERISCLSGAADMILPTLTLGGEGAIVAVGNVIPGHCVSLYKAFRKGDLVEAGRQQLTASFVNKVLVAESPQIAAIKAALNKMGYGAGFPRGPLLPLAPKADEAVEDMLRQVRLL